jgi:hypothetical protein
MDETGHIRCVSDCSILGELFFSTFWVWPALGVALALGGLAFRMPRKLTGSLR